MEKIKRFFIGKAKDPKDIHVFKHLSLVAFLAWVGLGADGLSSSCYGPEEAFLALGEHTYLGIFVALASSLTVFIISLSYIQIIELFPSGGGGYLVASKLLSPTVGMISGSALLIDYVLTITISIASGADALFSFLPQKFLEFKLYFAVAGLFVLTILNLRGIKEAVLPLVPIFISFVVLHLFAIIYALSSHFSDIGNVYNNTTNEVSNSVNQLGIFGVIFLILRAYSMGAGTFTGIEAVSNGIPILREPKVETGKRTMIYMASSLAFTVIGLMLAYLLFDVKHQHGKTLNAVLFVTISSGWNINLASIFIFAILLSEAILLFIAAQAGFMDGPRVLANMAVDRWLPSRFAMLSDRLVTKNGILVMSAIAFTIMLITNGNVKLLVVLYSINVFVTFSISQLGMVKHWWGEPKNKHVITKLIINGIGLVLTIFILFSVIILKFSEGGWITLIITSIIIALSFTIKNHYNNTFKLFKSLDVIVDSVSSSMYDYTIKNDTPKEIIKNTDKTAVLLVNDFNGLGLHALLSIFRMFGKTFKNYVFVQIGILDTGNFKGSTEVGNLEKHVKEETEKYVNLMANRGYYAESYTALGIDVVEEVDKMLPLITQKFPNAVFFGGQIVLKKENFATKFLHNYIVFTIQKRLYSLGLPFLILPVKL